MLININNYHVLEGTTQGYYGNGELPDDYDYEAATEQLQCTNLDGSGLTDEDLFIIGVRS